MKIVPVLSGLLGVVAGLLFGLLLWGQGQASVAAPAAESDAAQRRDADILAALRDLREAVDRQSLAARAGLRTESGAESDAPPGNAAGVQPLTPDAATSIDEFKRVLDQAVRDLRDLSVSGPASLATIEPDVDAPDRVAKLLASGKKGEWVGEELTLLTPRDIYRMLGKPRDVHASAVGLEWTYRPTLPSDRKPTSPNFRVEFTDGYVVRVVLVDTQ